MKIILPFVFFLFSACGQLSLSSDDHSSEEGVEELGQSNASVNDIGNDIQEGVKKPSTDASVSSSDNSDAANPQGEVSAEQAGDPQVNTVQNEPETEEPIEAAPPCVADEALAAPASIEEAVALINSLPMPVSIICFLQALKKPFKLVATNSNLSAQPAEGDDNPRFFLFYDQLIVSVVPEGEGKDLVEFSYLLSTRESIKGELEFPVMAPLELTEPYTTSLNRRGTGTRCAVCHVNERAASADFPQGAYISKAIKPKPTQISPQFTLDRILLECQSTRSDRCAMLNALLEFPYEVTSFPETMPSFF